MLEETSGFDEKRTIHGVAHIDKKFLTILSVDICFACFFLLWSKKERTGILAALNPVEQNTKKHSDGQQDGHFGNQNALARSE